MRARERSPRAAGAPDVAARGVAARVPSAASSVCVVSLRLSRVATSSPPRTVDRAIRSRVYLRESQRRRRHRGIVSLKIEINKTHVLDLPQTSRARWVRFWSGPVGLEEKVWENLGVFQEDPSILRTLSEFLEILGEVCETHKVEALSTLWTSWSTWDISHKFKAFLEQVYERWQTSL